MCGSMIWIRGGAHPAPAMTSCNSWHAANFTGMLRLITSVITWNVTVMLHTSFK
jgi:hypothetical protein